MYEYINSFFSDAIMDNSRLSDIDTHQNLFGIDFKSHMEIILS